MTIPKTRSLAESLAPASTFETVIGDRDVRTAVESGPSKARVFFLEAYSHQAEPIPDRHVSVGALIDRWSTDPARNAALVRARGWLADVTNVANGDTVRTLRRRKGLSQSQLAEAIGTSQPHIARIERGTDNVTIDTCRRLASALGIDLNTLDAALRRQEAVAAGRSSRS